MQVLETNNYVTEDGIIHHNSGKSSACVMDIVRRAHEQKPGPDGIRRSRWAVVRNCYDDQTEILTEKRGWQLFRNLLPDDKVACLENDHLIYKLPDGVLEYDYNGEMLGFEGESIDFLVTPEHLMWVSKRRTRKKIWGDYEIMPASEVYGNELIRVRKDARWNGTKPNASLDFFEFLGFWFAEGSAGKYKYESRSTPSMRLNITQKKHTEYVENLLSRNNLTYKKTSKKDSNGCYTYHLESNKHLLHHMDDLFLTAGKQTVRHVPQWIKDASPDYLKSFIHGFFMGDGGNSDGTTRLHTSSKILADDLQEMILKAGMVANIGMSDYSGKEVCINGKKGKVNNPSYRVTILNEKRYRPVLKLNLNHTNHLKGWYKKQYDGKVYCVNMPAIPVYVRRNGNAFWCLRSYGQLKDTTIRTFHDWFPPKLFGEYRVTDHTYIITKFPGVHLEILFRALDRPDQVSNLLSLEVTGAWFNEVREIPQTIIEAMDARIGRYPSKRDGGPSWYGIIMDTNPPDEDSYIYNMFERIKPDNWEIFKQPSGLSAHAENTKHLPKDYYKNLAKGKDEMYIRVYIHGQYGFIVAGKPVFMTFKDNVHVAPNILLPERGLDVVLGFDFGLQPACTIGQHSKRGQLRILDELVSDGMGIRRFCNDQLLPLLRQKYFGYSVVGYGDPSGTSRAPTDESTCFEVLQSREIGLHNIVPAPTNAIMPRVGAVETYLGKMVDGEPGFLLSPNCRHLRKALNGGYHYERDRKSVNNEYKAMPVKNFSSHIADSLEMLCLYLQEKADADKRNKEFMAQIARLQHHSGSTLAGY